MAVLKNRIAHLNKKAHIVNSLTKTIYHYIVYHCICLSTLYIIVYVYLHCIFYPDKQQTIIWHYK